MINIKQGARQRIYITLDDLDLDVDNFSDVEFFLGVKAERRDLNYLFSKADTDFDKTSAGTGIVSVLLTEEDTRENGMLFGELKLLFNDSDQTLYKSSDIFINVQKATTA
jgi:hypothetical protein